MNYFELYPGDYLRDTTRLSLVEHGAYLRLLMAYYAEEQPLPGDVAELYVIAGAISAADKAAVRKVADRYFPLGPDGRRRNTRADAEIAKASARIDGSRDRKSNETERQRRTRARRTKLFADLREVGIVPDAMTSMADLKALHAEHVTRDMAVTEAVLSRVTERDNTGEVTGVNTGIHTPHATRHISPTDSPSHPTRARAGACEGRVGVWEGHSGEDGAGDEPAVPVGAKVSPYARAAIALREAGVRCTSQNPDLIAAVDAGVTPEHLVEIAAQYPGKPVRYVCVVALRELRERSAPESVRAVEAGATPRPLAPSRQAQAIAGLLHPTPPDHEGRHGDEHPRLVHEGHR